MKKHHYISVIITIFILTGLINETYGQGKGQTSSINQKKRSNRVAYRSYFYQKPYFELGFMAGPAFGLTDAAPSEPDAQPNFLEFRASDMRFTGGIYGRYRINPFFGVRGELNYTMLAGDDASSPEPLVRERGRSFTNNIFEFSAIGELYLPSRVKTYNQQINDFSFNYYFLGGVSIIYHNPIVSGPFVDGQQSYIDEYDRVQQTSEDAYSKIQPLFPVGTGLYFNIKEQYTIGAELGIKLSLFDYLDGFRRPEALRYDHFYFGTVRLGYIIKQGRRNSNQNIEKQVFKPKQKD
ncbi:MAG: hypothetical protein GX587_14410 [Bacteroidales bacterium]|nr:hypothetical protein [Bacteroidales bacterium]